MLGLYRKLLLVAPLVALACAVQAQRPGVEVGKTDARPPLSAVNALGEYKSPLIFQGFLFVNGKYIKPPYQVAYRGNAIYINSMLIDKPLSWPEETAPAVASDSTDEASVEATPAEPVKDNDDFLLTDGERQAATVAAVAEEQPVKPMSEMTDAEKLAAVMKNEALLKKMRDAMKASAKLYEDYLTYGDFVFLGKTHFCVTGSYQSGKALFEVLPKILRTTNTPMELMTALSRADILFLDIRICEALFAHRLAFSDIEARRMQLKIAPPPPVRKKG